MTRGSTEYFMYDISEIHLILEEALRPVFRIDKQEARKKKRIIKQNRKSKNAGVPLDNTDYKDDANDSAPEGMSSHSEDDDDNEWNFDGPDGTKNPFYDSLDKKLSEKERRQKAKMMMINKRVEELIEVLDVCIADL